MLQRSILPTKLSANTNVNTHIFRWRNGRRIRQLEFRIYYFYYFGFH